MDDCQHHSQEIERLVTSIDALEKRLGAMERSMERGAGFVGGILFLGGIIWAVFSTFSGK